VVHFNFNPKDYIQHFVPHAGPWLIVVVVFFSVVGRVNQFDVYINDNALFGWIRNA